MTTWHDRLQEALNARQLDWPDLVAPTGRKKPSIYAWKPDANDRSTMMNGDNAALVCEFLKINPLWLFYGRGPSGRRTDITSEREQTTTRRRIRSAAVSPDARRKQIAYRLSISQPGNARYPSDDCEWGHRQFLMAQRGAVTRPRLRLIKG